MKKLIYSMLTAALVFTSCSSDESGLTSDGGNPEAKSQVITVNVNNISEFTETSSTLRSASLQDAGVNDLYYLVYNQSDGRYIKGKRYSEQTTWNIKDTLPQGNYKIVIFASTTKKIENPPYDDPFDYASKGFGIIPIAIGAPSLTDYFYKDFTLTVSPTTKNMDVSLERLTSKIEIIPTDATSIPSDIKSVVFLMKDLSFISFEYFKQPAVKPHILSVMEKDNSQHPLLAVTNAEMHSVNDLNPISFLLVALGSQTEYPIVAGFLKDGESKPSSYKVLKGSYNLERNKVYRLKGRLFTNEIESGTINVDTEWNETIHSDFD